MLRLIVDTGGLMATAAPNPNSNENGPERARRIFNSNMDEDIRERIMRNNASLPPDEPPPPLNPPLVIEQYPGPARNGRPWWNSGFFPLFWTIASALSLTINVLLCLLIFGLLSVRGPITKTVTGQSTGVLGGLYSNFQAMDQATIRSNIPVDASIPLNIMVPVNNAGATITMVGAPAEFDAHVVINTSVLKINAPARVTLLRSVTPLSVNLTGLVVPVQNSVPVHLDVPVNIPLNQTELHQPFVGLQEVVRPWYCLFLPRTDAIYIQTCANTTLPIPTGIFTP
jgi:hypothetical protein